MSLSNSYSPGQSFSYKNQLYRVGYNLKVISLSPEGKALGQRPIDAGIMRQLLDTRPGKPLPWALPWRHIGDVRVSIDPPKGDKRRRHRIVAECPVCFEIVPFGRLRQHQKGASCTAERVKQMQQARESV